jgi:cytoskeletal protein CcmA (bactofilin family)
MILALCDIKGGLMMREYGYDVIDGRRVPQLVVTKDHVIAGIHQGTVHVEAGTLYLRGTLQGTLDVQNGAFVEVTGEQQGTVTIASGAKITVVGAIQGTTTVEPKASLVIEASGKVAGTLCNHGLVILRGVFGGAQSGAGSLCIEDNGYIKQPVVKDGINYYEW